MAASSKYWTLEEALSNLPGLLNEAKLATQYVESSDGRYAIQFQRNGTQALDDLLSKPGPLQDGDIDFD